MLNARNQATSHPNVAKNRRKILRLQKYGVARTDTIDQQGAVNKSFVMGRLRSAETAIAFAKSRDISLISVCALSFRQLFATAAKRCKDGLLDGQEE